MTFPPSAAMTTWNSDSENRGERAALVFLLNKSARTCFDYLSSRRFSPVRLRQLCLFTDDSANAQSRRRTGRLIRDTVAGASAPENLQKDHCCRNRACRIALLRLLGLIGGTGGLRGAACFLSDPMSSSLCQHQGPLSSLGIVEFVAHFPEIDQATAG